MKYYSDQHQRGFPDHEIKYARYLDLRYLSKPDLYHEKDVSYNNEINTIPR